VADLFADSEDPAPRRRAQEDRPGPRPWFGCDTSSEAWRAYCEAWSHLYERKPGRSRQAIGDARGPKALAMLEADMEVVKRDMSGQIVDRATIPELLGQLPKGWRPPQGFQPTRGRR
jgi:hypothetical protein